jgi:formate dehydrogenase subunit delta
MSQMSTTERLVYMANQIARNFEVAGEAKAVLSTADHIAAFWDPLMKQRIFTLASVTGHGLGPIAAQAVDLLIAGGAPQSQSPATGFGDQNYSGASDAG